MNVRTYGECLTPLLVAAKYSVKDSILEMMSLRDRVLTSAVSADGQNALHLVVQNQQCGTCLDVCIR